MGYRGTYASFPFLKPIITNMNNTNENKIQITLENAITGRTLRKLVLSKPSDKAVIRTSGTLFDKSGEMLLQLESFTKDGKALHENITPESAPEYIAQLVISGAYSQLDILTTGGSCTVMRSKKGALHITDNIKSGEGSALEVASHDRKKSHILDGSEDFLIGLGISQETIDRHGNRTVRVNDRMRAKFRQINRFLELLSDVYNELPPMGRLVVYDLCCGKSYLTFAVWHYLCVIKKREVVMTGMDLKADVIEYCSDLAEKLGCTGLSFKCGDIAKLEVDATPSLVVSLHACDIATDIVLATAIKTGAKVILSTPCCHHEMMNQLDSAELGFIKHSILKQKLCDAATDSLRGLMLEIYGYEVSALELVDPEETPKNVMLRAVKRGISDDKAASLKGEYDAAVRLLGVDPMLRKLMMS
nr:SAM-dependent methyltransferase [Clostridia bacterium]